MIETGLENYVSSGVVKKYFALPKSSFEVLVKEGMPHIRIGAVRRFKLPEVEAWLIARGEASKLKKGERHEQKLSDVESDGPAQTPLRNHARASTNQLAPLRPGWGIQGDRRRG